MNKITVIGSGSVGATTAYTLTVTGVASEIVLIDINKDRAFGEALDIKQGISFCEPSYVYSGSYEDAKNSDIVIITSGIARKPGQSRLDLAQTNVDIIKSVAKEIVKYAPNAIYIIVSNPVDILTYVFQKVTGLPEEHVIGSGTILDTSRLCVRVAECFNVTPQDVHAHVFGEHGDSSFIPWSLVNISSVPIEVFKKYSLNESNGLKPDSPRFDHDEIKEYVQNSGGRIIQCKGATFYAISMLVAHICRSMLSGINSTMTVSTMFHGEYGINDVCLSILNIVGRNGVQNKVLMPMSDEEVLALRHSADCLKGIINSIKI